MGGSMSDELIDATLRDQIYRMEFLMTDGCTRCPKDILDLAINRYGEETVYKEMLKADKWLLSHAARHKKRRVSGIGLFLLNWFESAAFFRLRDAEQRKNSYNRWED
jgi:hypothetical protein